MNACDDQVNGRIHSFESFGALDGPGLRLVVFLQGCPLRCLYCHNPDTWEFAGGTSMTVAEVMARVERQRPYFQRGGGVTFSGGEPLAQPDFLQALLRSCIERGIHTAVDTGGGVWQPQRTPTLLALADLIILDIKAASPAAWARVTGNDGFAGLEQMLGWLRQTRRPAWIRQVVAVGLNDSPDAAQQLRDLLDGVNVERLELLPCHQLGREKWRRLGLCYGGESLLPPALEQLEQLHQLVVETKQKVKDL